MSTAVEREDWDELIQTLRVVEKGICSLGGDGDPKEKLEACRQALKAFHTTAAMLDLPDVEQAGIGLQVWLEEHIAPNPLNDAVYAFGFALNGLMDEMRKVANGDAVGINVGEILNILGPSSPEETKDQADGEGGDWSDEMAIQEIMKPSAPEHLPDFSRLERIVGNLGGRLSVELDGAAAPGFSLHFVAQSSVVEQIETLLSPSEPSMVLAPQLAQQDSRRERILGTVKEFMMALSSGDLRRSNEILLNLAEQQYQAGLYQEIGMLARDLHNSLKGFTTTLDPALREIVEDKIPDSGNRLEHILEITEKAANTTLDHVEMMQKRNEQDQQILNRLDEILNALKAIGEQAQKRLTDGHSLMGDLKSSVLQTQQDLITILTAQDFQDLTGQVIQKIMTLLKDLESKLINVIRVFGVKVEGAKKPQPKEEELYGPAHKQKDGALHSQDDVDSLLAEFGF